MKCTSLIKFIMIKLRYNGSLWKKIGFIGIQYIPLVGPALVIISIN